MALKILNVTLCLSLLVGCGSVETRSKRSSGDQASLTQDSSPGKKANSAKQTEKENRKKKSKRPGHLESQDPKPCSTLALLDDDMDRDDLNSDDNDSGNQGDWESGKVGMSSGQGGDEDTDDASAGDNIDESGSGTQVGGCKTPSGSGTNTSKGTSTATATSITTDAGTTTTTDAGTTNTPPAPSVSYANDIVQISAASCEGAGCHSGSRPAKSIALDSKTGWMASFNASLAAIQNGSMPLGRSALTNAQITKLKAWQTAGFPD